MADHLLSYDGTTYRLTAGEARGEGTDEVGQRMLAVRYSHHSQGRG